MPSAPRASRYQRFEPVTVRAAARVLRAGKEGRISPPEVAAYVAALTAMDRYAARAGRPACESLWRLAQRGSAYGRRALRLERGAVRVFTAAPLIRGPARL